MIKLNARQLRAQKPDLEELHNLKKNPVYIILDSVLDTYNIGAIFRLADAVAAKKVYLCGDMETPPNPRIKKASVSTWQWVEWEYVKSTVDAINKLKKEVPQIKIYAVEQDKNSIPLGQFKPQFPCAIIVGNESFGISAGVLGNVDQIVELPMYGVNCSLNVMVCLGIVLYRTIEHLP